MIVEFTALVFVSICISKQVIIIWINNDLEGWSNVHLFQGASYNKYHVEELTHTGFYFSPLV